MPDLTACQWFTDSLAAVGLPLSDDARQAIEFADAVTAFANQSAPGDDLRQSVLEGTATLEEVREQIRVTALDMAAREHRHTLSRDLLPALATRYGRAVAKDGDRIVAQLRKKWDPALKVLRAGVGVFPPDASPDVVLAGGREATAAWAAMTEGAAVLDAVAQVRTALSRDFGYGACHSPAQQIALFLTPHRAEDHDLAAVVWREPAAGPGGRWHRLLDAGFELALNNAQENNAQEAAAVAALAAEGAAQRHEDKHGWVGQSDPRRAFTYR